MKNQSNSDFYIPMKELETNGLYRISSRNAHIGIWFECTKGFVIPREKLGRKYIFVEYHWDTNEKCFPYGTAKPLKLIETSPFAVKDLFDYKESYIGFGWSINYDETSMINDLTDYLFKKN
jgi:hypothetical protein